MKNKHLSLLLIAAFITVGISAQTGPSQPPQKGGLIQNQKPLKIPPPTKLPAQPTGKEASKLVQHNSTAKSQPANPSGGATK